MNDNSDQRLDALFAAARREPADTSRVEFGFETRLMARLREESNPFAAISNLAWKLCPFFAALALAASLWSRTPGVRAEAGAQLFAEVTRTSEEQAMLSYMTGDER
jgi:hypothetical protein